MFPSWGISSAARRTKKSATNSSSSFGPPFCQRPKSPPSPLAPRKTACRASAASKGRSRARRAAASRRPTVTSNWKKKRINERPRLISLDNPPSNSPGYNEMNVILTQKDRPWNLFRCPTALLFAFFCCCFVSCLTLPLRAADVADCDPVSLQDAIDTGDGVVTFTEDCEMTLTDTISLTGDLIIDAQGHTVTI